MATFRGTLQKLSTRRIREARILLQAKEYPGAYYVAGFSVECGLKACIAKASRRYEFPDRARAIEAWTHSLPKLLRLADIPLQAAMAANLQLKINWDQVSKWEVDARYDLETTRQQAIDFCNAVDDPSDGVLTWIRKHW